MTKKYLIKNGVANVIEGDYWQLSREELKTLASELIWQLEQSRGNLENAERETIKVLDDEGFFDEE